MKAISLRGVPDDVYEELRRWAAESRRSIQEQVKTVLEREVSLARSARSVHLERWRERLKGRRWGNLVADIRAERRR